MKRVLRTLESPYFVRGMELAPLSTVEFRPWMSGHAMPLPPGHQAYPPLQGEVGKFRRCRRQASVGKAKRARD